MSLEQLITDNIDTWTSTVTTKSTAGRGSSKKLELYGVKKLRELILELAVRGKLVPQDPNDEPASLLLERIAAEKAKLVKEKKIKTPKKLAEINDDERPFELPKGWSFIRLNEYGEWGSGSTPKRSNSEYYGGEIPWFKSGELTGDYISKSEETITELALAETSVRYNNVGDVLVAMYGATIGKTAILSVRATTNQAVCACTPFSGLSNTYLLLILKAYKSRLIGMGAGGAQPNISREKIINTVVALPSTNEQHRIVAKVDELMKLCDQLEQQTEASIEAHQVLVTTLLDTLTNSANAEELMQIWQMIAEHFDRLFTTEESIDKLKQTILQLAVMGKLVPQDPNDEPAAKLLERIGEEKAQLIKDKKIKKQKALPPIAEDEKPFELPNGWEWCRFGTLVNFKAELVRPENFTNFEQIAPDSIEKGTGRLIKRRTVAESGVKGPNSRFYTGQILYSKIRPSLSKAIIAEFDGLCSADMYPLEPMIDSEFLLKTILSEVFLIQVRVVENRIKMPKLNVDSLSNILVPICPENEMRRITTKLSELMFVSDQLKHCIHKSQRTQIQLTDAIVEQVV